MTTLEVRCGTCRYFQRKATVCLGCTDIGTSVYRKWEPADNSLMPQSTKERQESLRAKRAMLGMTEVRGIYLPPELHAELKAEARKMAKRASAKIPPHSETTGSK